MLMLALVPTARAGDVPSIVQQPENSMLQAGCTLQLSCVVTGTPPISYIWRRDQVFLSDQTNSTLVITNAEPTDSGRYLLAASNDYGITQSAPAQVVVDTLPPCYYPPTWVALYSNPEVVTNEYGRLPWDAAVDMAVDKQGNVIIGGNSINFDGSGNFFYLTAKYDPNGGLAWVRNHYGDGGNQAAVEAVTADDSGNVYVTGYSYTLRSPMGGDNDCVTIKYDSNGNQLWLARYDSPGNGHDRGLDVEVDGLGNCYVTGVSATIKYDANGNEQWVIPCRGDDLKLSPTGDSLYVASKPGPSMYPGCGLQKYGTNGETLWVKGMPATDYWEGNGFLTVDGAGNAYVTGRNGTSPWITEQAETTKFGPDGQQLWSVIYEGPCARARVKWLTVDKSGAVYIVGSTSVSSAPPDSDAFVVKYDAGGNKVWERLFDGPAHTEDSARNVAVDDQGHLFVTVCSSTSYNSVGYGMILKYDPNGNLLWSSLLASAGPFSYQYAYVALAVDGAGNVYAAAGANSQGAMTVKFDQHEPRLGAHGLFGGAFLGCLASEMGSVYTVKTSDDLRTWTPVETVTNINGLIPFHDFKASESAHRFYRAEGL